MIRGFHSTDSGPFELQILVIRGACTDSEAIESCGTIIKESTE